MAWRYCRHCQNPIPQPTVREFIEDNHVQCKSCLECQHFSESEKGEALAELLDRIEAIEQRLGIAVL